MPSAMPTLLYIDDDPALARLVDRGLTRLGFNVIHAASGKIGLERLQPIEARHVLIERNDIDAALGEAIQSGLAVGRIFNVEAEPRQPAADQPGKRLVIVDIKNRGQRSGHVAACGT